jgi:anti-sigma-K factor RskA
MSTDDDKDVLAAEYVLGTLDADDRANAQMLLAIDPSFVATVARWERQLGELHSLVEAVEPPESMWERVKARVEGTAQAAPLWLPAADEPQQAPETPEPPVVTTDPERAEPPKPTAPRRIGGDVVALRASIRRWRAATGTITALAATLVGVMLMRELRPDMLPGALRPTPREVIRTVEVPSPQMAEFVAILQQDASSPAFLLTIDLEKRSLSVRKVGAEAQAGRSYELWLVSDRAPAPRSLGVIGQNEYTVHRGLPFDAPTLHNATYAVSLEPAGGSPTGAPTGPVLYTGKLVQTAPSGFPDVAP